MYVSTAWRLVKHRENFIFTSLFFCKERSQELWKTFNGRGQTYKSLKLCLDCKLNDNVNVYIALNAFCMLGFQLTEATSVNIKNRYSNEDVAQVVLEESVRPEAMLEVFTMLKIQIVVLLFATPCKCTNSEYLAAPIFRVKDIFKNIKSVLWSRDSSAV
jgi:hypothetical protein